MIIRLSLAIAALTLASTAHAAPVTQTVYEGTIGKSAIVLETLATDAGGETLKAGRYFYRKYRTDIPFRVGAASAFEELAADCYDLPTCETRAQIRLAPSPDGLTGTWTAAGGAKAIPVTLKRIATRTAEVETAPTGISDLLYALDGGPVADDPYAFRRLSAATTYGPETRIGRTGYQTATDTDTGIHFIRLTATADPDMMAGANTLLDQRRFEMISYGLECRAMPAEDNASAGSLGGWEDYESHVTYATDTLLVIQESGSTYCGGAYPNNTFSYAMYDLKHGEVFDIDRVLKTHQPGKDADGNDAEVDTPAFAALKAKLTPQSPWLTGGSDIPECVPEDLGYGYTLAFSDKGLVFALTDLPHVMGACMGDYYVVPWSELKGLWTPEAASYFPQAGQPYIEHRS